MKVILLQDIKGTGKKEQIVDISDGYARNYLLPRKMAVEATADNINTMRMNDKAKRETEQRAREEAAALSAKSRFSSPTRRYCVSASSRCSRSTAAAVSAG